MRNSLPFTTIIFYFFLIFQFVSMIKQCSMLHNSSLFIRMVNNTTGEKLHRHTKRFSPNYMPLATKQWLMGVYLAEYNGLEYIAISHQQ